MTSLDHERDKYKGIYSAKSGYGGYGHSNHGKKAVPYVAEKTGATSVLDVGCGYNEFKREVLKLKPGLKIEGVDFACPGADVIADAHKLPYKDKQWDLLTSFDMLEHILPDQVDPVLAEFARVSNRFMFSISHQPSVIKWQGENLHPTVHSEKWWIMRIMHHGGCAIKIIHGYITGDWKPNLKLPRDKKIILVGNGPSASNANGKTIDAFDEVIRFNTYHLVDKDEKGKVIKDWRPFVGEKTTIWSTFGKGTHLTQKERPDRVIYIHGEKGEYGYQAKEEYRLQRWYYDYIGECLRARNMWLSGLQGDPWQPSPERGLIPSSGLLVASWLLQVIGVDKLTIVGFDHFSKEESKLHHYWIPKPFKKPKEHSGTAEHAIFNELEHHGRIEYLKKA